MDSKAFKRYKIFSEMSEEKLVEWFDYTQHKFINHIDATVMIKTSESSLH